MASGPKRFAAGGILKKDQLQAPGPGAYTDGIVSKPGHRVTNRKKIMVSNVRCVRALPPVAQCCAGSVTFVGAMFVLQAPRFKNMPGQNAEVTPGPGTYDMEYVYGSLHKRTFNMTIAEQEAGW